MQETLIPPLNDNIVPSEELMASYQKCWTVSLAVRRTLSSATCYNSILRTADWIYSKTWAGEKSHAGSKIDLGLYSGRKMKGIQSYRPPSRVSLQARLLSVCYSGECPRISHMQCQHKPRTRQSRRLKQKCPRRFMASEYTFRLFSG